MMIGKTIKDNYDSIFFIIMIVSLNTHLIGICNPESLILFPEAVKKGEWRRLFTHPFVHVSWYHLTLDAGAFMALYLNLQKKRGLRLIHTLICGFASFVTIWFFSTKVSDIGFCGLSGIAHGLMVILSLEMIFDSKVFFQSQKSKVGLIVFVIIMLKCASELTGNGMIPNFHFGLCGNPIYESHFGGIIGGIVSFFIFEFRGVHTPPDSMLTSEENNDKHLKSREKHIAI